ncbi:MAG: hypothetical protein RQ757_01045 [Pseudomonadales bacterium]|nr:hypothetical protein [Pseudomonadales bacterium]
MDAIKFRTLIEAEEIEKYLSKFEGYVQVKLPYDYASRSKIVAGFKGEEMVAGYMLVTKPAFRSLMFVPDEVKSSHDFFKNDQYEMMEINGLWIGPGLKTAADQFQVWLNLVWDTFMLKKQYVLIMSDARNQNATHMYSLTGSKVLYEGPPMLMAGARSHAGIRFSYTTRWQLLLNIPRYWMEYKSRERRFFKRIKQRQYARVAKAS